MVMLEGGAMEWSPMNLCQCVGSVWLAWTITVLCGGVIFFYLLIAHRWLQAARLASEDCRAIWVWLIVIFVVCALAGYGSRIIAMYDPRLAVPFLVIVLVAQNIACPIFLYASSGRKFLTVGRYDAVGCQIFNAVAEELSDYELASVARTAVKKNLERMSSGSRRVD